jgi:hypothetical protein
MICAPIIMTTTERAQAAGPHHDQRSLKPFAWFSSPRGIARLTAFHRETNDIRRPTHGSALTFESLRGVRLPLVSGPHTTERLLQRV